MLRSTARPPTTIRIRSRSGGPTASATDLAARAPRARISFIETDRNFEPRAQETDDFAALLAAIRAGDPRAEERLFARFGRPVALLLDRHTRGREEREDLFQDTFRLLIEKLRRGEVREPEKLPGYVAQLAKNLAIEHYRKAARRKTDPAPPEDLDRPTAGGALENLLAAENAALARAVIGELGTARDREVLLRFYLGDEDRDRLCRDLDLTSIQFHRVLHRARQRYKELYLARVQARGAASASASLLWLGGLLLHLASQTLSTSRAGA
jgi:RNA polymerase sigma-70 factor (ECF subfamily)